MHIDISPSHFLHNSTHWFEKIDQLYRPTSTFGQDTAEIIYARDVLGESNYSFLPIILKEWLYLLKDDGYLVLDYKPSEHISFDPIEKTLWQFMRDYYDLVCHEPALPESLEDLDVEKLQKQISDKVSAYEEQLDVSRQLGPPFPVVKVPSEQDGYMRLILQKINATAVENDSMDKWTFGILTMGNREEWLQKVIDSIRMQKIPSYEIVLCGSYYDRKEPDIRYIPYNKRAGWITKQKNLIVESAQYENVCVIHDRIVFPENWYEGMKKWGNCFEHLGLPQLYNGDRAGDWLHVDPDVVVKFSNGGYFFPMQYQDYADWSPTSYSSGSLHIGKKHILTEVPWNETLYWNQAEDYALQQDLHAGGYLTRFNPYAKTEVLAWRFPTDKTNKIRLLPRIGTGVFRIIFKIFPMHKEWIFSKGMYIYYELPRIIRKRLNL